MIWYKIENEFNVKTTAFFGQFFKVFHCSIFWKRWRKKLWMWLNSFLLKFQLTTDLVEFHRNQKYHIRNLSLGSKLSRWNRIYSIQFDQLFIQLTYNTLNMGESHTPSMPISLRYSNFDVIPFKSPMPSLSLSLNDLIE